MNLIELTAFITMLSGLMAGAGSGKDFWGMIGLFLGAIYGFAIGLGIAVLLDKVDRLTWGWSKTNRGAIFALGIGLGMAFAGPALSAASAVAVTLLINCWL